MIIKGEILVFVTSIFIQNKRNTSNDAYLGPIYTKHQRQYCDNSGMMLAVLFSLKTMELLQNGVATYFQATPLISMRTESQASL